MKDQIEKLLQSEGLNFKTLFLYPDIITNDSMSNDIGNIHTLNGYIGKIQLEDGSIAKIILTIAIHKKSGFENNGN